MATGAYPGTFNPPTVAHLAIAEAALTQAGLDDIHLVVSRQPLGKNPTVPSFEHRISVLEALAGRLGWLAVRVSSARLVVDVVRGYDAVIMGTDKWAQVADPAWYGGSRAERDAAVADLPRILLAPRPGPSRAPPLPPGSLVLTLPPGTAQVSSSAVRAGAAAWMVPEAAEFDARTGAWTDPGSYPRPGASKSDIVAD